MIVHPIAPLYSSKSKALILGSFPSVKSREAGFYYAHRQNRFWRVMAGVLSSDVPETIEEKTRLIIDNELALWDVIKSCEIIGSSDSSIKNVIANDIGIITNNSQIEKIFVNGKKAEALYKKYIEKDIGIKAICLPSTSPANASWSEEMLLEYWRRQINNKFQEE